MTIEQTVEIPPNHRLLIAVPPEVPTGKVILTFTPVSSATVKDYNPNIEAENVIKSPTPHSDRLLGLFSSLGNMALEEIRDERLTKHLQ
jgi:hypothetical protein